jgi:hypothetical protein
VYFRPLAANRSATGVLIGPPKALEAPNPTSSIRTISTLGAPFGWRSASIGGNFVVRVLGVVRGHPTYDASGTGRMSRLLEFRSLILGLLMRVVEQASDAGFEAGARPTK